MKKLLSLLATLGLLLSFGCGGGDDASTDTDDANTGDAQTEEKKEAGDATTDEKSE